MWFISFAISDKIADHGRKSNQENEKSCYGGRRFEAIENVDMIGIYQNKDSYFLQQRSNSFLKSFVDKILIVNCYSVIIQFETMLLVCM